MKNRDGIYYELDFFDVVLLHGQVREKEFNDLNKKIFVRVWLHFLFLHLMLIYYYQ